MPETETAAADGHEGRLLHAILAHAAVRPDAPALSCGAERLTWRQLSSRTRALAAAIAAACGGEPGRVALLGATSADMVVAYLATVAAGGCAVPLPLSAHPDAVRGMLADCEPSLVFADQAGLAVLDGAAAVPVVGIGCTAEGVQTLADFIGPDSVPAEPVAAGPGAPFNIIYSSGTTGRPKGIVHSHAMRYRQAARGLFGIDGSSAMLLATPLYSNTTLMPLLAALFHGAHTVLMAKFDAETYLDLAERVRASHTMLVPVQYQRILAAESFGRRDLGAFRLKQCTGAPLPPAVKQAVSARWPGRFLEIYGLTEGGCTCTLDVGAFPGKAHTVGRPAPGTEIRIVDESGRDLPPGARGEIIGRSPMMMSGYFRNEEATAAFRWRDPAGGVFHRTGDVGMVDADGFVVLLDRKKDMIISGGFNIYASDLEETLRAHPDVLEAAVIAVPSEAWGETPLGLVVPRPGTDPDPAALLAWANGRLGKMQRLSAVELRDALPLSAMGKVLKQELRRPYWAGRS